MQRPLLIVAISYIIGIVIGVYFRMSIPFILIILIINCIIINKKYLKVIIIIIMTIIISSTETIYLNNRYDNINENLNAKSIKLIGTICSQIEETDYKYIVTIKTEKRYKNVKMIIYFNKDKVELEKLTYGNEIVIAGKYNEPDGRRNYKGFNYKEYLKTKEIYGIIECESEVQVVKIKNLNFIQLAINNLSIKIQQNLDKILLKDTKDLAVGILLGVSSDIDSEVKQNFRDCNLSHMLAISGSHLTYLILGLNLLLNKKILGIRKCKVITIIIIIIFMLIVNMSSSIVRAGICTIISILGTLIYRKSDSYTAIAISLLFSLIKNPFSLFNIGLQLSYLATLGIIIFYTMLSKIKISEGKLKKYIIENIISTLSANILILPITTYYFNTIPTNFLLSNLVTGPVLGISLIFELITVFISFISIKLAQIPGAVVNVCLILLTKITKIISKIPNITVVTPKIASVILIYIIILNVWLYTNKKNIYKNLKISRLLCILIIIILIINFLNIERTMRIYFIDQTTPNMIQRIIGIFERKPLISKEI